jgi:hypothetical protein
LFIDDDACIDQARSWQLVRRLRMTHDKSL